MGNARSRFVMPNQLNQIPIGTRMWFATVGIIAGNAVLLLYLMGAAAYMRALLLRDHMGEPQLQFEQYWDLFLLCGVFTIAGWVVVGIPVAIVFPARLLAHRSWPVLGSLIGITLGPVALLLVFIAYLALEGGLRTASFDDTEWYWVFSIIVSTVSFLVYAALLCRRALTQVVSS
jgi:hypothetical protein